MLGFIPDFQYSGDPRVNPYANPFASMPAGMYQAGVYSAQPTYAHIPPEIPIPQPIDWSITAVRTPAKISAMNGLGYVMAWPDDVIANNRMGPTKYAQLYGVVDTIKANKWPLLLGLAAAAGLAYWKLR